VSSENLPQRAIDGFAASIELPEGHQLILGELPPGTVVEVATWQGVGRPDDSANRFLLTADGPGLKKRRIRESQAIESAEQISISSTASNFITPEKINTAHSDSYLGVGVITDEPINAVSDSRTPGSSGLRNFGRGLFTVVAVFSIFSVVLNFLGVSVTVPTEGPKTSLGNVTDSLVLYKRSTVFENNVALVSSSKNDGVRRVVIGASSTFDAQSIGLSTTNGTVLVNPNTIAGKSFLVLPYVGKVLKPLFN
jgi:hypothetical protein